MIDHAAVVGDFVVRLVDTLDQGAIADTVPSNVRVGTDREKLPLTETQTLDRVLINFQYLMQHGFVAGVKDQHLAGVATDGDKRLA